MPVSVWLRNKMRCCLVLALVVLGSSSLVAKDKPVKYGADGYPVVKTHLAGDVDEYLNLEYLPAWRYSGDKSPRSDARMVLDLWVPKGRDDCPVVVYVHGGAYAAGSKFLSPACRPWGSVS